MAPAAVPSQQLIGGELSVPSQQLINGELWICKVDPKKHKPYYFEKRLKKAQWDTPAGWIAGDPASERGVPGETVTNSSLMKVQAAPFASLPREFEELTESRGTPEASTAEQTQARAGKVETVSNHSRASSALEKDSGRLAGSETVAAQVGWNESSAVDSAVIGDESSAEDSSSEEPSEEPSSALAATAGSPTVSSLKVQAGPFGSLPREIEELTESRGRPETASSVATDDQKEVSSVLAATAGVPVSLQPPAAVVVVQPKVARAAPPPPPPEADSYGHYTVVLTAGIAWRSTPSFDSTAILNEALVEAGTRMIGRVIRSDDGLEYFESRYV